jgi:hypothetical protein
MSSFDTLIVFSPFLTLLVGMILSFAIIHIADNR